MTVRVQKEAINLREKLSELEFDRVPFQKMPAGSVLQVVTHDSGSTATTTSTTWTATNASATITPISTNSIIVAYFTGMILKEGSTAEGQFEVRRDGSSINNNNWSFGASNSVAVYGPYTIHTQDSPNTTSPVTYTLYFRLNIAGSTLYFYRDVRVTLMEIAQ